MSAQQQPPPSRYTPAPGAKDLKAVLFNWFWHTDMLRGPQNNPLNKVEAFYAGKLVEKRNGTTMRDLTTVETETGNAYVVMPVPASVRQPAQR